MEKITSSQKKIVIVASVILLANLAFWLFIYLPNKNKVSRIKSELQAVQGEVREIEAMIGETESVEETIRFLIGRSQELNAKFPQKEEESLKMLSQLTRKSNIELVSIKPRPKVVFRDENKKEVKIEGKTCRKIFVSMQISCFYKDLVKYIETLKENLPAFVTIESLKLKKGGAKTPRLNVTLNINLYLLS